MLNATALLPYAYGEESLQIENLQTESLQIETL
jgi:hypothetical protein